MNAEFCTILCKRPSYWQRQAYMRMCMKVQVLATLKTKKWPSMPINSSRKRANHATTPKALYYKTKRIGDDMQSHMLASESCTSLASRRAGRQKAKVLVRWLQTHSYEEFFKVMPQVKDHTRLIPVTLWQKQLV